MEKQRIQKVISQLGYCSRRKAEEYLRLGLIEVNGTKVTEMGFLCTPEDEIKIDGKIINPKEEIKSVYLMVNKPIDVISTAFDPQGRRTVLDLVPTKYGRVFPVGRLDQNSQGLLILTNDGEFANLVTHPSSAPEKEYIVHVKNPVRGDEIEKLKKGLYIITEGYKASSAIADVLDDGEEDCVFSIIIHEGKKREVRHMMETLNHPVISLKRVRIGNIYLGNLEEGKYQEISPEVILKLKNECLKNKSENKKRPDRIR